LAGSSLLSCYVDAYGETGSSIVPGEPAAERASYDQTILEGRPRCAVEHLNPSIPADCLDDVVRRLQRQEVPSLMQSNRLFHRWW